MNLRQKLTVFAVTLATVLGLAGGVSYASYPSTIPADPTAGAMTSLEGTVQTWVTTYAVPVIFSLLALGILLRLGIKWMRRAGSKV